MAHRYSASINRAGPVNSGAAYAEMLAGATKSISVRSVSVTAASATGGEVALVRASSIGTGTSIATGLAHRSGSPVTAARLQSAWSSAPTGAVPVFRSELLPSATGGQRELWHEDDGPLVLEPGTSLLLINQASGIHGGGLRINVTWEEGPLSDR